MHACGRRPSFVPSKGRAAGWSASSASLNIISVVFRRNLVATWPLSKRVIIGGFPGWSQADRDGFGDVSGCPPIFSLDKRCNCCTIHTTNVRECDWRSPRLFPRRPVLMMTNQFAKLLKRLRAERNLTLREFCLRNGLDPGNWSRLERGLYPPPQNRETLEKYATALQLTPGTDEWLEFFDVAAAARGEIPADLMSDANLVERLPVLFRTLRGQPVSSDKLDELIEKVRRS
jgi:transcriptional regulator with XRE-family HTH domain